MAVEVTVTLRFDDLEFEEWELERELELAFSGYQHFQVATVVDIEEV